MTFSKEEREIVIGCYKQSRGYANRAVLLINNRFYITPPSVVKIWKKYGFPIRTRGGNNNPHGYGGKSRRKPEDVCLERRF